MSTPRKFIDQRQGFFHKIVGGGVDLLSGMIFDPRPGRSQMWGDSCRGWSQMRGDLEKLSTEAKNAPYSKIRANCKVELSNAVLSLK